jgi:SAM-dependent methyltransferase
VDPGLLAALRSPEGEAALAAAAEVAGGEPLAAAAALRARAVPPALASAALTQVELRGRGAGKFGPDAARMFFTRTGLEQATRGVVARRRAARLAGSGVSSVADLGCGVGADAIAFARAGLRVHAVDTDPLTASVAAANAAALGLSGVRVSTVDAQALPLDGYDAVFCDPARRTATGRRVFDPGSYSPPWEFVAGLPARVAHTVLKLAPGVDHGLLPAGAEGEWVSVDGEVVEAAVWCGPLASVPRRASVLRGGSWSSLTGSGRQEAPVGPVRRWLYDPDGAVVRAHLVAEFAAPLRGCLGDATIAYVYADTAVATPFGRCFEVLDVLPFGVKRLRAALRARGVGRVTVMKRGSAVDVERLRRELRLAGPGSAVVVLTRVAGAPTALICTRHLS